jgi:hypothetical protein
LVNPVPGQQQRGPRRREAPSSQNRCQRAAQGEERKGEVEEEAEEAEEEEEEEEDKQQL